MATESEDDGVVSFGKTVVAGIQEKNVSFMAAGIAYQAFISLLPLLVLVFFVVTVVGDEQFAAEVATATSGFLPESGQVMIENAIAESPATAGSTLIGVVVLVWGALKIFRGLDTAFSEIYDSAAESSFVGQLRDAVIVLGAIGGALIAAGAASLVIAIFPDVPFLELLNPILLVIVLVLAFLPMYYYFPDVDVSPRQVLPGVVVAAVGWTVLQSLFQVYVSFAGSSDSAGPVGAILLLLTWLYFGGLILLVGAVVNAVRSGHFDQSDVDDPVLDTSIAATDRPAFVDDARRDRTRLLDRIDRLERERDQLRNDLAAQRARRYRLEDRVTHLETLTRDLEDETATLHRELDQHEDPPWKRRFNTVLSHVDTIRIGVVEDRRD
ncbi:YhjD/YihY/BrkB family envelope integrity protein [Natrialba asiatica]|uniref:Ribonuclease BN n=1 Tax=Natrialba asiatica (strain ATCC 700177 / DSM 12278 / JCM 9576 / FERM P-10747 / NBRC 102637 / 172P1) TaxID=29540 RepID=M0ARS2_NATA1|nr:YhjD/YihY/BrkB family envelope integrity protein [Natrialba asiatica]ELZ01007.1 ribonuclease BN [Natrialba asiatica DSM 12278]